MQRIMTPLCVKELLQLKAGDRVALSGIVYTARDAAHRRLIEVLRRREEPPFPLAGSVIYYVGPTPAPPGKVIGAAGPTTSFRMDPFTPELLAQGVKGFIGKGMRSASVKEALIEYKGVYFAATGGAGALLAQRIKAMDLVAYPELGPEAVYRLQVEDMPLYVINDAHGGDFYEEGVRQYSRKREG